VAPKLGIIAGGGDLPRRLVAACRARGRALFVLVLDGQSDAADFAGVPHAAIRLGAAGEGFRLLRDAGVVEVVFAGRVRRPSLADLRPDWRVIRFLASVGGRLHGDDRLVTAVIKAVEAEGFRVIAASDLLGELIVAAGPLGRRVPSATDSQDIALGLRVARAMGQLDVGHAVIVQAGVVLGIEAAEGTDALIRRCAALRVDGTGGVLVKIRKPEQDLRADPPVIGVDTVRLAAESGLAGIAVEAGGTLVLDRAAVTAAADGADLFVVAVDARE
jgi:UDP-2,3-diacylglucosamine hydrolase